MTVREATIDDAPAIAALTNELGYVATVEAVSERLTRLINRSDHRVCVAVVDGAVAGWVQAHASDTLGSGSRVEIVGLVVATGFRRRGIGRTLVRDVEEWSAELRVESLVARTNVQREESQVFYPALGFTAVKAQAVYRKHLSDERKALQPTGCPPARVSGG